MKRMLLCLFMSLTQMVQGQWETMHHEASTGRHIRDFHFYNAKEGYIAFADALAHTADQGRTVSRFSTYRGLDTLINFAYRSKQVYAPGRDTIVCAGNIINIPLIIRSTDAGQNWKVVYREDNPDGSALPTGLERMIFLNRSTGFVTRKNGILRTTDGGASWQPIFTQVDEYVSSIYFADDQYGCVATDKRLLRTINGGASWSTVSNITPDNLFFLDRMNGFASGFIWVSKTTDGGLTWSQTNHPAYEKGGAMYFTDANNGFSTGNEENSILRTISGGKFWEVQPSSTKSNEIFWLLKAFGGQLFAAGTNGLLMKAANDGGPVTPSVLFRIDRDSFCVDRKIRVTNESPDHYAMRWYVNGRLTDSSYNLIYSSLPDRKDSIKLVVSKGSLTDSVSQYITVPDDIAPTIDASVSRTWVCPNQYEYLKLNRTDYGVTYRVFVNGVLKEERAGDGSPYTFSLILPPVDTSRIRVEARRNTYCGYKYAYHDLMSFRVNPPNAPALIPAADTVCPQFRMKVTLRNSRPGYRYFIDSTLSPAHNGNGGDLYFEVMPERFISAQTTVPFVFQSSIPVWMTDMEHGCGTFQSSTSAQTVTREVRADITLRQQQLFTGMTLPITVATKNAARSIWHSDSTGVSGNDDTTMLEKIRFITPGLKNIVYRVTSREGCRDSSRVFIQMIGDSILSSRLHVRCDMDTFAGNSLYNVRDMAFDRFGNRYVTGYLQEYPWQQYGNERQGLFVRKIDSAGRLQWDRQLHTYIYSYWDHLYAERMAVDDVENVYLFGHQRNAFYPSGELIKSSTAGDAGGNFLMKINRLGVIVWTKRFNTPGIGKTGLGSGGLLAGRNNDLYLIVSDQGDIRYTFTNTVLSYSLPGWCRILLHIDSDFNLLDYRILPSGSMSVYDPYAYGFGYHNHDRLEEARFDRSGRLVFIQPLNKNNFQSAAFDGITPSYPIDTVSHALLFYDTTSRKVKKLLPFHHHRSGRTAGYQPVSWAVDDSGHYFASENSEYGITANNGNIGNDFWVRESFLYRYDSTGVLEWTNKMTGVNIDGMAGISDNLLIWGNTSIRGTRTWYGAQQDPVISSFSRSGGLSKGVRTFGYNDMLLGTLDMQGDLKHIEVMGTSEYDFATHAKADQQGRFWISGTTRNSTVLGKALGNVYTNFIARVGVEGQCAPSTSASTDKYLKLDKTQVRLTCRNDSLTVPWSSNMTGPLTLRASYPGGSNLRIIDNGLNATSQFTRIAIDALHTAFPDRPDSLELSMVAMQGSDWFRTMLNLESLRIDSAMSNTSRLVAMPQLSGLRYRWYRNDTLLAEESNILNTPTTGKYRVQLDAGNQCLGPLSNEYAFPVIPTGLPMIPASAFGYRIYPNPVQEVMWVEFQLKKYSDVRWQLIDLQGRVVLNKEWGKLPQGRHHRLVGENMKLKGSGHFTGLLFTSEGQSAIPILMY